METKNLIKMANDIGNFFISYPDEEQAKKETASHIQKFWHRDMRNQIKEHVSDTSEKNSQLNPFVFNAIRKYLND
jgi:formate dehydrogenase subunit delta